MYVFHNGTTYLIPRKVSQFISIQVSEVPMLWRLFYNKVDVCWTVEGMWNVDNLLINLPAEAFLHGKVEGLNRDDPGHNVHRNMQVLHCGKTIADIHCEDIIAL